MLVKGATGVTFTLTEQPHTKCSGQYQLSHTWGWKWPEGPGCSNKYSAKVRSPLPAKRIQWIKMCRQESRGPQHQIPYVLWKSLIQNAAPYKMQQAVSTEPLHTKCSEQYQLSHSIQNAASSINWATPYKMQQALSTEELHAAGSINWATP